MQKTTIIHWPHGHIVYLITDPDQEQRMITEVGFSRKGEVIYEVTSSDGVRTCYDYELTEEKNILATL